MRRRHAHTQALRFDPRPWMALSLGALTALLIAAAAHAAPDQPVLKPPAHVDPKMQVAPKNTSRLSTPVIKPPLMRNGTTVIPK